MPSRALDASYADIGHSEGVLASFPFSSPAVALQRQGGTASAEAIPPAGATAPVDIHGAAHGAFMTLPTYTRTREGEVPPLGNGPIPCRLGLGVRKGSPTFDR